MIRCLASVIIVASLLAGCSKQDERAKDVAKNPAVTPRYETADGRTPPAIDPTAAPGVAFAYKYAFNLPDVKISAVQEAHAARCEALGVGRCRITGLRYSVDDDDRVDASLDVKLSPDIARAFGKESTGDVVKAGGRLSQTEFTGEDTIPVTAAANSNKADAERQIADIERRIAAKATGDRERTQLQLQLADLHQQRSEARTVIAGQGALLASTPMTFTYLGKGGITGFRGENPLFEAGKSFVASMVAMISIVLQFLAWVLPWALLLALLVILFRSPPGRSVRRWIRGRTGGGDNDVLNSD